MVSLAMGRGGPEDACEDSPGTGWGSRHFLWSGIAHAEQMGYGQLGHERCWIVRKCFRRTLAGVLCDVRQGAEPIVALRAHSYRAEHGDPRPHQCRFGAWLFCHPPFHQIRVGRFGCQHQRSVGPQLEIRSCFLQYLVCAEVPSRPEVGARPRQLVIIGSRMPSVLSVERFSDQVPFLHVKPGKGGQPADLGRKCPSVQCRLRARPPAEGIALTIDRPSARTLSLRSCDLLMIFSLSRCRNRQGNAFPGGHAVFAPERAEPV